MDDGRCNGCSDGLCWVVGDEEDIGGERALCREGERTLDAVDDVLFRLL